MTVASPEVTHQTVPVRKLTDEALLQLSIDMKLSLSADDMYAVQAHFAELDREPTDVELEVIAQTWSEHCKHRIFNARIEHRLPEKTEIVDSLFNTYIKEVTERIMESKPGFVLSAFHDNAGFIKVDDDHAACLKTETHNHPSAIEPYAGANTGLGGVIRDILGAGKGAKPIASLDVFCFGEPGMKSADIKADDVIHPLGVFRGVVRGVRDYGNRMGIPTVTGAIHFDEEYTYNPLVFCGTAGVLPTRDIDKSVKPSMFIIAAGGRTGRDGLHGATFSSASLGTQSHDEDQGAVQIGNPIEEKKVADLILHARAEGLIDFITDCGAGGFSSAAGEMLSESGGVIYLERVPLKEPGLTSWEIFLSESQERMVLGIAPENKERLFELGAMYESECTILGEVTDSNRLLVKHNGETVCDLSCQFLHTSPRRFLNSTYQPAHMREPDYAATGLGADLCALLGHVNICSREPVIREYDHEVQGNTIQKPLAGATGDAPQDASVVALEGTDKYLAVSVALLPQYDRIDAYRMGLSTMDEAVRQLVTTGVDPDRIAVLDNFCMGNPDAPEELGRLVECCKAIATAAEAYGTPFVSGKDSFYNFFETREGPVSIPVTLLVSAMGLIDDVKHVIGASIRRRESALCMLGVTSAETGGTAYAKLKNRTLDGIVPDLNLDGMLSRYRRFHEAVKKGLIVSAHDLSEGGLAVAAAEMGFSMKAGIEIDLTGLLQSGPLSPVQQLFAESNGRILFEVDGEDVQELWHHFTGQPFAVIGRTSGEHLNLRIAERGRVHIEEPLEELKASWKNGLTPYY